jgi:hypothetical protein
MLGQVGERVESIIAEMASLYELTGVEYFKSQASGWSQWVWMLEDRKRQEWNLTYPGDAQGELTNGIALRKWPAVTPCASSG